MPVVKITANSLTWEQMRDHMDLSVAGVIDGSESLPEAGDRLFNTIMDVASGKKKRAEITGYTRAMDIYVVGPVIYEERVEYPKIAEISQRLNNTRVGNIETVIADEMKRVDLAGRIKPGSRVAITAGSRGITDMIPVLKAIISEVRKVGASPVIIPSMGSHGGATAEGQAEMLEGLGVSQQTLGIPVISSMDVVDLGETEEGIPVVLTCLLTDSISWLLTKAVKISAGPVWIPKSSAG